MKKQKLLAALAAVILLTSCNTGSADNTEEQSVAEASAQVSESVSETSAETTTETEAPAGNDTEPEYAEVSAGNEFIDFEFIENYQGTTDIGDLANKAVDFLKTTDFYAESIKNISEFSDGEFSDYIVDDVIVPKFNIAYPNDYDGDGKTETFIMVDMPYKTSIMNVTRNFLIFADSNENMEVLSDFSFFDPNSAQLLNYGKYKQIVIGAYGVVGADDHTLLLGVSNGKAKTLYSGRISFFKSDCFVCTFGWQGSGDFMYFDTAANEYRTIVGKSMTIDEIKAMDKDLTLKEYYDWYDENGYAIFVFIGEKYYNAALGPMDIGSFYTYEDGKFVLSNAAVRRSSNDYELKKVIGIDIDKAVAEMKPPVEPYAKVSEDNVFIDYKFIEDYQGTTDIGVLAAGAVEFLTESEYYAESTENIGEFTDEKFKKYFDESGNILPRLQTAYPEDYDGDGSTETFIIVDMPYMIGTPTERSFLIFADSRGEMTLLNDVSAIYPTTLLDYGDFKQITFGGKGVVGMDDHTLLYGVVNGKAKNLCGIRGEFYKKDCFLSTFGAQSTGAFMYYDTVACEYRAIAGEDIPIEKIKEMDTTNALSEFYEWLDEYGSLYAELIGGRYYVIIQDAMDTGTVYLYENGEFIQTEDCKYVRDSHYGGIDNIVLDIDITKAIAEMKPVAN
ncbi:MAG: hypothetical protein K2J11_05210 [Oscillospiraceae bacterium]|nr:hypothetical protein [Oscillospiraceae bacterium]